MRSLQLAQLQRLVLHAYENVPFYRALYSKAGFEPGDLKSLDDFHRLPLVRKEDIIESYPHNMLASGAKLSDLIVSRSSGSSGKVLDVAYDTKAMLTYIVAGLRLFKMGFPYRPWHRQLYIYTSPYPLQSLFGLYPLYFVPTLAPLAEIVEGLRRVRPELVVCYPSHLRQIAAEIASSSARSLGIRMISVNSEMSTQAERDELAKHFGCIVLDEYSSEELTRIAAQCTARCYHIFEDINYLETVDEAGLQTAAEGIVVGTNLHNFAMPIIRYLQNDRAQIVEQECRCGWNFRGLQSFQGRANDSFTLPSGKILSSGFLLDATYDLLLDERSMIREFCLMQISPTSAVLEVVPGTGWCDTVAEAIERRLHRLFQEQLEVKVLVVSSCTSTKTGKRNPIINKVARASEVSC